MNGDPDSRDARRRIGAAAKARFLAALRAGARREDAAEGAGFTLVAFYGARRRDPVFKAGWKEALAAPLADERRARAYAERGEVRIAPANRRPLQRRRRRHVRFDSAAQAVFLAHLAATCDTRASAAAAGVSESAVYLHCRMNPDFSSLCAQAMREGRFFLQAEAVRQRLAAQAILRAAVEKGLNNPLRNGEGSGAKHGGEVGRAACPTCGQTPDAGAEFDRTMKLFARLDRKPRRAERGFKEGGRRQRWTFDRAIAELDRILRGMGVRGPPPPAPPEGAEE